MTRFVSTACRLGIYICPTPTVPPANTSTHHPNITLPPTATSPTDGPTDSTGLIVVLVLTCGFAFGLILAGFYLRRQGQ